MTWHVMCHVVNSLQELSGLILLFDHPIDECHIIWDRNLGGVALHLDIITQDWEMS